MSIYDYTEKPHPAGFVGYRVAVMVDGKFKQKYFNTRALNADKEKLYKKAQEIDQAWLEQKEKAEQSRNNKAVAMTHAIHSTGVRGISLNWRYSPDRYGNKRAYKKMRYSVYVMKKGKRFARTFPSTQDGWVAAVEYLAKSKGLSRWRHLLDRQ